MDRTHNKRVQSVNQPNENESLSGAGLFVAIALLLFAAVLCTWSFMEKTEMLS